MSYPKSAQRCSKKSEREAKAAAHAECHGGSRKNHVKVVAEQAYDDAAVAAVHEVTDGGAASEQNEEAFSPRKSTRPKRASDNVSKDE